MKPQLQSLVRKEAVPGNLEENTAEPTVYIAAIEAELLKPLIPKYCS
jgi:hypothetical protein